MAAVLKLHRDAIDERPPSDRPKPPPPAPSMSAPEWTTKLVTLLSQLENRRARMPGRVRGNETAILDAIEGMIADCEAVAAEATFSDELNGEQAEALAKAGAFLMATHDSRQATPTGVFRSLWKVITTKDDSIAPQIRACLLAGFEALSAYFALFTRAFPSSATSRNWVEAASAFLGEFNTQIREYPE